ncbi:MAG: hypothetical protein KF764_06095 [Labilithrix sp.]|nr:hypothetical protein [Labilithrix sp.]MBX3224040.1 hypothetical protein [Labilithrix sp.]
MRRTLILGLGLVAAAVITVPARAETSPDQEYPPCAAAVSANDSELAHQKYIAGKLDYDEANYESAVRRFRDAYALDCTKHELLIIISAAYERKGAKAEAVTALEAYVARVPSAPDIGTYRAKIENLKKQIAAAAPPPAPPAPPPAEVQGHTVYPWIVVGAGVVALGVGIAVVATAPDLPPGCDEKTKACATLPGDSPGDPARRQSDAGKAVDQPRWGTVVAVGGGVLIAGGLLWHFLEPTGPKESAKAKLRPAVAPGYAGLALGGAF